MCPHCPCIRHACFVASMLQAETVSVTCDSALDSSPRLHLALSDVCLMQACTNSALLFNLVPPQHQASAPAACFRRCLRA